MMGSCRKIPEPKSTGQWLLFSGNYLFPLIKLIWFFLHTHIMLCSRPGTHSLLNSWTNKFSSTRWQLSLKRTESPQDQDFAKLWYFWSWPSTESRKGVKTISSDGTLRHKMFMGHLDQGTCLTGGLQDLVSGRTKAPIHHSTEFLPANMTLCLDYLTLPS